MQLLKTKWFSRFARHERIDDAALRAAMLRAERGLVDAELGGGLIKQRVARKGQGRSGGYRIIVAYRAEDRLVFLFGFSKSERENITPGELATLRELAAYWFVADVERITEALAKNDLEEIPYGSEEA